MVIEIELFESTNEKSTVNCNKEREIITVNLYQFELMFK